MAMYTLSGQYYDKLYAFKDYRREAAYLQQAVEQAPLRSGGRRLLDLACGSGQHLAWLQAGFTVSGLDLSPDLLALARARLPGASFYQTDMADFALEERFDVLTCLFSSIGYLKTPERVRQALACWQRHLLPGGVLLVEPWFTPQAWKSGSVHALLVDEPELKIARLSTSQVEGRLSYFDFHYLIATPEGTHHLVERHELGLFETQEQLDWLVGVGFVVHFDPQGPSGRGLFVACKPV